MASNAKRRRRKVLVVDGGEKKENPANVNAKPECSDDATEDELFAFHNKQTMDRLNEEVEAQVHKELAEDCAKESVGYDGPCSRKRGSRTWSLVENSDKPSKGTSKKERKGDKDNSSDSTIVSDDDDYLLSPTFHSVLGMPSEEAQVLHSEVARTLHNLKANKESMSADNELVVIDSTTSSPSQNYSITMRIRCRGKVYRYKTLTVKPLSEVISRLARDLGVVKERLLVSFKSENISLNATPHSLNISTVDILDALVLEKPMSLDDSTTGVESSVSDQITIKVQSSNNSVSYRLGKTDPLEKVLAAFSAVLEAAHEDVHFEFDGERVLPSNTANELGLEDDDVIDARLTK